MLAWLNLLDMGGGQTPIDTDVNTLHVLHENTTLTAYRGIFEVKTIYLDKADTKRVSVDWSHWLATGTSIASSSWEVEDSNTSLSVASDSATSDVTEAYLSTTFGYGNRLYLKNTIVTDEAIPETASRSLDIFIVRTT